MSRFSLLLLFGFTTTIVSAQPAAPAPAPVPETSPILKALPADGDPNAPSTLAPATASLDGPLPSAEGKPAGDDAVRLQIFLDQNYFGPGVVDGRPGRFTELAVLAWNEVNGHPSDDWQAVMDAARKAVPNPLATAVVPEVVKDWVDPSLPTARSAQAKKKKMAYRSIAEFMSERYHCDVPYLIELNGAKKIRGLKARDSIVVPNITPFHVEALVETKFEADPSMSARHVVVDTKINQVRIFEATPVALVVADPENPNASPLPRRGNKGLVASFPITPGKPQFIKFGTWELKNMVVLPWWRYDESLLKTGKRSSNALMIPAGPNSPVGVIWCGTSRSGIGMHGTSDPETIGRARSAGCIRLANWDAIRLPTIIRPGSTVEIR